LAVDLFFLLSGFVIGNSYDHRLATGQLSAGAFCLVRLIRLYPMYLISLLLVSSMYIEGLLAHHRIGAEHFNPGNFAAMIAGLFMLPMKVSGDLRFYPLNIVYWSLFFELLCNFAYAALHARLTNRVLLTIVIICAVTLVAMVHLNRSIDLGPVWTGLSLSGGLVRSLLGICGGLLLYRLQARSALSRLGSAHPVLAMLLIALVLGLPSIGEWDWLLQLLAVFIIFPACLASGIAERHAPPGSRSVGSRYLALLGLASYPIYVLHLPLGHFVDVLAGRRLPGFAPLSGIFVTLLIAVIGIALAQRLDAPLRKYLTIMVFGERPRVPLVTAAVVQTR
jgi:peptidoglycan/LPS O-acetylase OafA/YrhL